MYLYLEAILGHTHTCTQTKLWSKYLFIFKSLIPWALFHGQSAGNDLISQFKMPFKMQNKTGFNVLIMHFKAPGSFGDKKNVTITKSGEGGRGGNGITCNSSCHEKDSIQITEQKFLSILPKGSSFQRLFSSLPFCLLKPTLTNTHMNLQRKRDGGWLISPFLNLGVVNSVLGKKIGSTQW